MNSLWCKSIKSRVGPPLPMANTYHDTYGATRLDRALRMYDAPGHSIERITRLRSGLIIYVVRSQRHPRLTYNVDPSRPRCSCPDFTIRQTPQCKHIMLVNLVRRSERRALRPRVGSQFGGATTDRGTCDSCGSEAHYACEGCATATYCSPECQQRHWDDTHAGACAESNHGRRSGGKCRGHA